MRIAKFINRLKITWDRNNTSYKKRMFQIRMLITGDYHPSSYPYISSDSFRSLAHHKLDVIDESTIYPRVHDGDIIFVNNRYIKNFFEFIHPHISARYVLISHYDTTSTDPSYIKYLEDTTIIHWFAKNATIKHPKITPIPIGLDNLSLYGTGVTSIFKSLQKKSLVEKKPRIFYHFKIATNPIERQPAFDYISKHPFAETMDHKLSPRLYFKNLVNYMAVLSPNGAGIECHRTWEALYLGVIPIVTRSYMMEYFESIGVSLWIVDSWKDLNGITEKDIEEKYNKFIKNKNNKVLYIDYWIDKIENIRKHLNLSVAPLPKKNPSRIKTRIYNGSIRIKSSWKKWSQITIRKILVIKRKILGMPKTEISYDIAILCVKRPAYVNLAINNINSCHYINPNHNFIIYVDDICEKTFKTISNQLDYSNKVTIKNQFGKSNQPWQYSKVEMIIDTAQKGMISMDADELWHQDIKLDLNKITFLSISTVFKDKKTERGVIENIFKKPEWLNFLHITSGFISIPSHFMTDKLANDMRNFTRTIFESDASFLPELERPECKRLAEEFGVCLAIQANYKIENITTIKIKDGAKNKEFLQPLYYGCERQINE